MASQPTELPYFDGILERLAIDDPQTIAAFSRHVHWGYWPDPSTATGLGDDYAAAAERMCRAVCDAAKIQDGMRVLDVGCGFGGTIASLNERFAELKLVGVNIDARQLERAHERVQPNHGNSIEFLQADAADIPLPDESFDVVLAVECVFHFDRQRFFSEAARLLDGEGNLALSDFVPSERALEYLDLIDFSANEEIRWSYGDVDLSYSIDRYRQLAKANHFELRETNDITAGTLPTYDFLYASTANWPDAQQVRLFTRATRKLEKACRNEILHYQILHFSRAT